MFYVLKTTQQQSLKSSGVMAKKSEEGGGQNFGLSKKFYPTTLNLSLKKQL